MPQEGYRCIECVGEPTRCAPCRERKAEARRKLRASRRKEGLCTECGKRAKPSYTRCARHIADNAARSLASHQRE